MERRSTCVPLSRCKCSSSGTTTVTPAVATRNDLVVCGNLTFVTGAVMGGGNAVYVEGGWALGVWGGVKLCACVRKC